MYMGVIYFSQIVSNLFESPHCNILVCHVNLLGSQFPEVIMSFST